jgi:NTP pyrophosphatase (non-canonical NTP hydrolase)
MSPKWQNEAAKIHAALTKHLFVTWDEEDKRFLALALCGEAGELANLVKKQWRDGFNPERRHEITMELADIRIYLELQAIAYGVDLDTICEHKLAELYKRWPDKLNSSTSAIKV